MSGARSLLNAYADHRYGLLFYSLLASLALPPLLHLAGRGADVMEAFLAVNLLAAVSALGRGRARRVALAIAAVALVARPGAAWLEAQAVSLASLLVWGLVALLAAAGALRHSLRGREVGSEQVYAALSAYLLAGMFFGLLYWVVAQFEPGALSVGGASDPGGLRVATTIYFSFVTLASLGYGDVLPVSDLARGLAVVEVVGGQLYLAVLVSRLVGAWR